jgi:hypothetical protein
VKGIRSAHKLLVRKSEQKRPLGRCRHRWENNINMDFRESMDRINLAHDRN